MKFNLTVNTNAKTLLTANGNQFVVKEIQKNRLAQNTIENKITILFNNLESYKNIGEPLITSNISYLKIETENKEIIFERSNIQPIDISIFSNIGTEEISLDIVVFDKII